MFFSHKFVLFQSLRFLVQRLLIHVIRLIPVITVGRRKEKGVHKRPSEGRKLTYFYKLPLFTVTQLHSFFIYPGYGSLGLQFNSTYLLFLLPILCKPKRTVQPFLKVIKSCLHFLLVFSRTYPLCSLLSTSHLFNFKRSSQS